MDKVKLVSFGKDVYPFFPTLASAFSFLSEKFNSFEIEDVFCLSDVCYSDDCYYKLYQILFSFISNGESISDSLVVATSD